jgi:hypothetical protein
LCEQVRAALPGALGAHVTHASTRRQELTIWLDSGAFCARLRFEAPRLRSALATVLEAPIERVLVRVRPGPAPGPRAKTPAKSSR